MRLLLFRHLWGVSGSWEEVFPKFKAAGYHGIETSVPPPEDCERLQRLLSQHGLELILQVFTSGETVDAHLESFRRQIEEARLLRPHLINAHSGRDAWDESEALRFFERALAIEDAAGVTVAHETHRGRILFQPWICRRLLAQFKRLQLCCDYSHWVCVCERLLEDQHEILQQCASRCVHLHARVGYEQGPQVSDPRAPEYAAQLAAHESWWRMIWDAQDGRGDETSTLTPEFGPPGYAHTLPFTGMPVSDVWEICDWQARRQAANFVRREANVHATTAAVPSPKG
jgi:sugar phosphate isomerase/epimerase